MKHTGWGWKITQKNWNFIERYLSFFFTDNEARMLIFVTYIVELPLISIFLALVGFVFRVIIVHQGNPWRVTNNFTFFHVIIFFIIISMCFEAICIFWYSWHIEGVDSWHATQSTISKVYMIRITQPEYLMLSVAHHKSLHHFIVDIFLLRALFVFKKRITFIEEVEVEPADRIVSFTEIEEGTVQKQTKIIKVYYMGTETYAFLIRVCLIHFTSHIAFITDSFIVFALSMSSLIFLLFNTIRKFGYFEKVKDGVYTLDKKLIHSCYHMVPRETTEVAKKLYCYDPINTNWFKWKPYIYLTIICIMLPMLGFFYFCYKNDITIYQPMQQHRIYKSNYTKDGPIYNNPGLLTVLLSTPFIMFFFITPHWIMKIKEETRFEQVEVAYLVFAILQNAAYYSLQQYTLAMLRYIYPSIPVFAFIFFIWVAFFLIMHKKFFKPNAGWTPVILYCFITLIHLVITVYYFDGNGIYMRFFNNHFFY